MPRIVFQSLVITACVCLACASLIAETKPSAGMLRDPDVSQDRIVFSYAGDLWTVDRSGGLASPLASPSGQERTPRFSPDGQHIAFVGNYEGDTDLYVIPTAGGPARRMTYHPGNEALCDWASDDELIYSTDSFAAFGRRTQLFTISEQHPVPQRVPVPYGANGTIQGGWLAYTPFARDSRTWKRYRGGMASDIWLFHLKKHRSRQVTDWEGTDSFPMWHDDELYYLSDAGPKHRLNIWKYDLDSGKHTQITKFKRYDVKSPAIGPGTKGEGEIVFQVGADLRLLNLKTKRSQVVQVTIPGDRPQLRAHRVDAARFIRSISLSPKAKRLAVGARGDVWTVPVENGSPRNLTRTSGVAERSPSWSPDGKWISYFSDATGEYQLMLCSSDGSGEPQALTTDGAAFRFDPIWSPDSKKIMFHDQAGAMFVHDVAEERTWQFDQDSYASAPSVSWSHDSAWLAYTSSLASVPRTQIKVLHLESEETHAISSGYFSDDYPAFDREGKFLYFTSQRDFSQPKYEDVGNSFIYDNTEVLVAVPLRDDVKHPLLPTSDEETWESESDGDSDAAEESAEEAKDQPKEKRSKGKKNRKRKSKKKSSKSTDDNDESEDAEEEKTPALEIDFDGIQARSFQLPVPSGQFDGLAVTGDGGLIYVRRSTKSGRGNGSAIKLLVIKDGQAKEETVVDGAGGFELTADGSQLLTSRGGSLYVVKAASGQKLDEAVSTDGMHVEIDRRAEWRQMFLDAWRIERDFFYDPNMHGVNWKAVRKQYEKLLDDCVSRYDLSFVIREMIAELNVGHAYYREGDVERGPNQGVGLLGCRFEISGEHIVFAELWQGGSWDTDARNPLIAVGVQTGDKLLAVENEPVTTEQNPYRHFIGKLGRSVRLRVQTGDEDPRTVVVKPSSSDYQLRFWAGIEATRQQVAEASDGQVGYIYVTNTSINGQNDLFRQFYAQQEKAALIVDDRWNGGGQIPTRFIELLNRPVTNYWARRAGNDWVWPPDSHQGPKCMLINGMAGSGGDMFPALFRQAGLGKLIGRRTWGGLVGITGYPSLIDGASVTAPSFAYYETDGTWGIEGHGVDPDIEVIDDPALMVDGGDPQLDAAIELMLEEIEDYPTPPARPPYPQRAKMGLPEEDR